MGETISAIVARNINARPNKKPYNTAERAIRPNVIIRKITNGHRTEEMQHPTRY